MDQDELNKILERHEAWLNDLPDAERADLHDANLCGANLHGVNLYRANLHGVNLHDANLCGTNLHDANLYGANLHDANLCGTTLHDANLYGANLHGVNLYRANLHGTNLHDANLCGANLHDANLCGANLHGVSLYRANLHGTKIAVISAGPLGRNNRITYYKYEIDEVDCGCFRGTLDEFAARVKETHRDNPVHLARYRAAIEMFRVVRGEVDGTGKD
jgi:hypothetical protein